MKIATMALIAPLFATAAPAPLRAQAQPVSGPLAALPIVRERLPNGLRVVMSPDRTVPTVAVAVYYDVGSRNEERGRTGFAHLFEHMMFQGSANVAKGDHFRLIMNRGGDPNGTTSEDRTNYFQTVPSNELELVLWLEADRMRSLAVTAENFENQRQTVMEERRQSYDNRAYAPSFLRINELAYGDFFPYAHSTIGDMQDLVNAPLSAVQEFFDRWYAPGNAVLSIAGDFEPAEAMELIRRHFGTIPARPVPRFELPEMAPQTSERVETMVDPLARLSAFHMAWHIPPSRTPDHYPLELVAIVLGDGESSRLYQKLVKQRELCQEIHVATDGRRGPDLFSIFAILNEGRSAVEARRVIDEEIADLARRGPTPRELEKARNRVRAAFVFGLQSNLSRAMRLAEFEMYWGNAELLRSELDVYLRVSAEDIRRVAAQYFVPTNRTVLDVVAAGAGSVAQPGVNP
ncbi:MAG: insulinase family protein [Myxococcota bacterium]|nr:insulinase family protein [Myxococcota bacterium]MDW8364123.1 pitrilysin family protein [Myxococcales bacterium]